MRRRGISEDTIRLIRQAYKLIYREHKSLDDARNTFLDQLDGSLPIELAQLLHFIEQSAKGRSGRAREAIRHRDAPAPEAHRRAA
jgi:UDP-N-acetylglucosamine acyltransferase